MNQYYHSQATLSTYKIKNKNSLPPNTQVKED